MNPQPAGNDTPLLYPEAIWRPLADHSSVGLPLAERNMVVLHITEGLSAQSAIATFAASERPARVSAHFVIEQDGRIYQLVDLNQTAWHASAVNSRSIGIEHVALSKDGAAWINRKIEDAIKTGKRKPYVAMLCTDAQYASSARLVKWLTSQMKGVQCTRDFVRTHNEASPGDGHVNCCTGALDPDRLVKLAASA
jgi:N-acetyl-anhydromuramyl-L-alanine amidase AmpD